MVFNATSEEAEFIKTLRQFQIEILRLPWEHVNAARAGIKEKLDKIFDLYVNIYSMDNHKIDKLLSLIDEHKINPTVKALIMGTCVHKLDEYNTKRHHMVRQHIVEDHIIKVLR